MWPTSWCPATGYLALKFLGMPKNLGAPGISPWAATRGATREAARTSEKRIFPVYVRFVSIKIIRSIATLKVGKASVVEFD